MTWLAECPKCYHRFRRRLSMTPKQYAVYEFIVCHRNALGYSPSFQEIADHFGYRSLATVHEHLKSLERKGWIESWEPRAARSLEPTLPVALHGEGP